MNDTHGVNGAGWYGFDLDGTLAKYDGWKGIDNIGEPVKPMVGLIKRMHDEGKVVKIMTARVAPREVPEYALNPFIALPTPAYAEAFIRVRGMFPEENFYSKGSWGPQDFIQDWCLKNLEFLPEIVYQKDHLMLELYDDRVKQVVPNEGWLVEDIARSKRSVIERTLVERQVIRAKWWDRLNFFLLGCMVSALFMLFLLRFTCSGVSLPEATQRLIDATDEFQQAVIEHQMEGILP